VRTPSSPEKVLAPLATEALLSDVQTQGKWGPRSHRPTDARKAARRTLVKGHNAAKGGEVLGRLTARTSDRKCWAEIGHIN